MPRVRNILASCMLSIHVALAEKIHEIEIELKREKKKIDCRWCRNF